MFRPESLSRLPDPTNVARYIRDGDQQRWRRSVGSNPLAPTNRVGRLSERLGHARFHSLGRWDEIAPACPIEGDPEPTDLNVPSGSVVSPSDEMGAGCGPCTYRPEAIASS